MRTWILLLVQLFVVSVTADHCLVTSRSASDPELEMAEQGGASTASFSHHTVSCFLPALLFYHPSMRELAEDIARMVKTRTKVHVLYN